MTVTEPAPSSPDPAKPIPRRPWWHRRLEAADRRRVMTDLALVRSEHWAFRFTVMITLSVVVATMGLWLDSAAVVIGAMLLAPLMQPVLATGASLSMALFSKALGSFLKVMAATTWCIAVAYLLSKVPFVVSDELTGEILARTGPDPKDLIVALAAGTAGAYATVRDDASASLPGVAVAVALVPPLATVGIALEAGQLSRALGALLLYSTNLIAIVFASILVFALTGFAPMQRMAAHRVRLLAANAALLAMVLIVGFVLYERSLEAVARNEEEDRALAVVNTWLAESNLTRTVNLEGVDDGNVHVVLRGFEFPPDQSQLDAAIAADDLLAGKVAFVEWIRTEQATTTTTAPKPVEQQLLEDVTAVANEWLLTTGDDYQIDNILIADGTVRVDAAGTGEPPPLSDLGERLALVDPGLVPRLNWVELETVRPGDDIPTPLELAQSNLEAVVAEWAASRGYLVRSVEFDGSQLDVEVAGVSEPSRFELSRLEVEVAAVAEQATLTLYYIARMPVTTTTAAPVPTTVG